MDFFGLSITKSKKDEELSGKIALPLDDEGASLSNAASYYGVFLDQDGLSKNEIQGITKSRDISLYPEIDIAIQDIINEAMPQESETTQLKILLDELTFSDDLKAKITDEFKTILKILDYNNTSADLFRRWYIDGRMYHQVIVDKANPKRGIVELILLDAAKIKKMREVKKKRTPQGVDVIDSVEDYYIYNERGFVGQTANGQTAPQQLTGVKLSPDAIIYTPSGLTDQNNGTVLSHLHKAIRPANQLRMLEDATVVYFIARAPERRIFYIDVGSLPKAKAEQYVKDIMNRYRNKMVYDAKTGEVKEDKKYMSMLEDFWLPRRDGGKGTEITTLPGSSNQSSMLENVEYFQKKLYQSLNIPVSRLQPDNGFSLGRTTEVSRDELNFQKFIDRLRNKFVQFVYDALKTQLILKGICNSVEWEDLKHDIHFRFQTDNYFSELKEQDVLNSRLLQLTQVNQYIGNYFSKEWIQKNILKMTDEEIDEMKDQINNEKDDPTAQIWSQQQMVQPPMMGQDPSMMGGGDSYQQSSQQPSDEEDQDQQDQDQQYPFK
jgi:hypothetical protein